MHVSPESNGDNPFVSIEPGTSYDYEFRVPADHPAGTFWYTRTTTAPSPTSFAGLAGALLVDGGPALAARERVLLITESSPPHPGRPSGGASSTAAPPGCWRCACRDQ
jgi:FtsP/CotA-like multicopper oxidase with cupredoxin domain